MQKRIILILALIVLLSVAVSAKQRLAGSTAIFHQPSIKPFSSLPVESADNGFAERKILLDNFPKINDKRVRRQDVEKIVLIRSLLAQTIDKGLYAGPDFKTLSCNGRIVFYKDRAMIRPLAELACLRNVQVPYLRSLGVGKPFVTGEAVRSFYRITGRATAPGIFSTPRVDCNEQLQGIAIEALQSIMRSERSLVDEEISISTCSNLNTARSQFLRGDTHLSASRFASAIDSYEDAWRKTVSCACKSI